MNSDSLPRDASSHDSPHPFNPLADPMLYLVVFLGGALGTAIRYGLSQWMPRTATDAGLWSATHPGTLAANLIACFVYAALGAALPNVASLSARGRQLANRGFGMGMCGGLSTMSTLALEGFTALRGGDPAQTVGAVLYLLITFALGLAVAVVGVAVGIRLGNHGRRRDDGTVVETREGMRNDDKGGRR